MATNQEAVAAEGLQLEAVVDNDPQAAIKMEEQEATGPKSPHEGIERSGKDLHIVQDWGSWVGATLSRVGTLATFQGLVIPECLKQEPKEELWEAQWQGFLKPIQSPHSEWISTKESEATQEDKGKAKSHTAPEACERVTGHPRNGLLRACDSPEPKGCGEVNGGTFSDGVLGAEAQRQRFRQFRYPKEKGPRGICSRLWYFCHLWLKPAERHTKEQIVDLVTLEQFLTILAPESQIWVREGGPETCTQAVALAEDFLRRQQEAGEPEQKVIVSLSE